MRTKQNGGFSLIEVNLAILIAALGLLMLFQLFPIGLRQSVQSESDLKQTAFANALFEEINANIRGNIVDRMNTQIFDDVKIWNNPNLFWKHAVEGMGLPAELQSLQTFGQIEGSAKVKSDNLKRDLNQRGIGAAPNPNLFFAVREDAVPHDGARIHVPPQAVIRLRVVQNNAPAYGQPGRGPNSYLVSVASTDAPYPAFVHNRQVYSREFYYQRRP